MKVLKFGGSSVAKPERIQGVVDILKTYYSKGEQFTVVFSAFGGVTDTLIEMGTLAAKGDEAYTKILDGFCQRHIDAANELLKGELLKQVLPELENNNEVLKNLLYGVFLVREASPRTLDYVLSFGERSSAFIIAYALRQAGINASYLDARKVIKTDSSFGAAKVDFELSYEKIKEYYSQNPEIQIVTGFIGSTKGGLTTTLGRGGSDYSAALLAAGLDAESIEIWTDVDGVLTADPRKVKKAFTIPSMTYAEAMEMSHFGAKVIYPPTLQPALLKKIPLYIKNTFNPLFPGTYISNTRSESDQAISGISSISNISLLTLQGGGLFGVPGTAGRLFNALAQGGINIILITQGSSEHSISFAVDPKSAHAAKKLVAKEFEYEMRTGLIEPIRIEDNLAVIAVIGENMRYQPGIAGRLFQALGKNGINIIAIAQGSSELNISVAIPREDEAKALNALHESFFLSDNQTLNLFIVGVGLIGKTLLKQVQEHAAFLKTKRSMEVKVIGLANSKKMVFDENGLDLSDWLSLLQNAESDMAMNVYVEKMKALNLTNSIFVDNTANENIARYYETILEASISISTPNKVAASSPYLQYQRLKYLADKKGVPFLYETNVGAGLPVISTLNDLIVSGDRIIKIEGVLSGSLSYIFNAFQAGTPFSQAVATARNLGFTEPDPRIDLNGIDVRRKLLILAREAGVVLDIDDIEIQNFLPEACQKAETVEAFMEALVSSEAYFENLREEAEKSNRALRMVAKLENKKATIGLESFDSKHPFYMLNGSDNMIVFTTDRYKDRPLVVQGPGAGAEVTAAGIFAEIIKIGHFLS